MKKLLKDFFEGQSINAYEYFGVHKVVINSKELYRFSCYAPNAKNIELVGDFNEWNGVEHKLEKISEEGIWQLFTSDIKEGDIYKYKIEDLNGEFVLKSDPFAFYSELRPNTSSIVYDYKDYVWRDTQWMRKRKKNFVKPLNIYECHLGSWKRSDDGSILNIDNLIDHLIPYVKDNGFTHVEIMPLNEHPLDASWGYQATGYYSPTSRYGKPSDIKRLIDEFHLNGIGVILDVVPAHFVKDIHGLATFDGKALYEYPKPEDAENHWGTLNFNLWDDRVRSFLISSFAYWIKEFHFDGLRFDAIAHVIYWGGNKYRGENEGAINFFKRCNHLLSKNFKNVMLIAEDSSDFYGVTKPTFDNGLGFDYKWDLGWMNDTLKYFSLDPIYRGGNHNLITFSMVYFYNEKFLLPFSHDEVVHGKKSIIDKIWGTYEQKFSQARLLTAYMYAHPGKKLNFMGNELAIFDEWNEAREIPFGVIKYPIHDSYLRFFRDINHVYKSKEAFYKNDYDYHGFKWIDVDNTKQSIFSFYRASKKSLIVCVFNMTPISYENYRLGVPKKGYYLEVINSQRDIYNGCNMCNYTPVKSEKMTSHGYENSINIRIAPFSAIYFEYKYRIR